MTTLAESILEDLLDSVGGDAVLNMLEDICARNHAKQLDSMGDDEGAVHAHWDIAAHNLSKVYWPS